MGQGAPAFIFWGCRGLEIRAKAEAADGVEVF
jgi:hypothetical protein